MLCWIYPEILFQKLIPNSWKPVFETLVSFVAFACFMSSNENWLLIKNHLIISFVSFSINENWSLSFELFPIFSKDQTSTRIRLLNQFSCEARLSQFPKEQTVFVDSIITAHKFIQNKTHLKSCNSPEKVKQMGNYLVDTAQTNRFLTNQVTTSLWKANTSAVHLVVWNATDYQ